MEVELLPATPRIELLRQHALTTLSTRSYNVAELRLWWGRGWLQSAGEPWVTVRQARRVAAVLDGLTPVIDPGELLVGKSCFRALTPAEDEELIRYRDASAPAEMPSYGQKSHMAIDFDKLLCLGVDGLRQQIAGYRARLDLGRPEDLETDAFYRASLIALEALVRYARRYVDLAEAQATQEPDPARAAELREIAAVCRRVPEFPAATFREALQSAHFVTFCLCAAQSQYLYQLGRPDRYLLPFYRRDLAAGRVTPAAALELIDCLGILLCEYTPRSLAVGWMVGGRDASGADICNELTVLFLQTIAHVRLSYPGVGLCWTPDTPRPVMELAGTLLARGLSHPALFNDEVITRSLQMAGLPPAEACLYQNSTCVEITPIASSNVYVASPYINLVGLLHRQLGISEDTLGSGMITEPLPQTGTRPATFADLLAGYHAWLSWAIRQGVIATNMEQATRRHTGSQPLTSCFVNDCLARGKDIDQGGARYNWFENSHVGLANLVDSLTVIRQLVYEERSLPLDELAQALASNYAGREDLRLRLLQRVAKYGNDEDRADELPALITGWIREEVRRYRTYLGGQIHSGFFCWVMHEELGRQTCASADGRSAGFPLGDGSGPAQGRERRGPTAAVLSATKWEHTGHLGGIAVNLKFQRPHNDREFVPRLLDVVETYLHRGGFEVQVNVVDRATLLAARAHPEQYRDLVVRIGGYSDYFVGLSAGMQDEIIMRTEHEM
jgi:trans-4-hydroxy-L-proline dehydratase